MLKIVLFFLTTLVLHANYNPFFSEPVKKVEKSPPTLPKQPVQIVQKPSELSVDAIYYGFVQTNRTNYALLESNNRSFVIGEGDSFYVDNQKIDIVRISSNQVLIRGANRYKTIYFSRKD